jgi:hypothetical protein
MWIGEVRAMTWNPAWWSSFWNFAMIGESYRDPAPGTRKTRGAGCSWYASEQTTPFSYQNTSGILRSGNGRRVSVLVGTVAGSGASRARGNPTTVASYGFTKG